MQAIAIASIDARTKCQRNLALAAASLHVEAAPSLHVEAAPSQTGSQHIEAPAQLDRRRAIHEAWLRGRQSWPRLALEREAFVRHCERVLGDAPASAWAPRGAA